MKSQSAIFDKSNLKGITPELQDEIIRRFNNYDLLIRVMKLTAGNLSDLITSVKLTGNNRDAEDIAYLAKRLRSATYPEWQKENSLYY